MMNVKIPRTVRIVDKGSPIDWPWWWQFMVGCILVEEVHFETGVIGLWSSWCVL